MIVFFQVESVTYDRQMSNIDPFVENVVQFPDFFHTGCSFLDTFVIRKHFLHLPHECPKGTLQVLPARFRPGEVERVPQEEKEGSGGEDGRANSLHHLHYLQGAHLPRNEVQCPQGTHSIQKFK